MESNVNQERQQAHALLDMLPAEQLNAVRSLLEVMVHPASREEDEEISAEEEQAVARSKEWFQHNEGIPFEQVVADLGFTMDQVRNRKGPAA
jgi:hypothetical protein